MLGAVLAVPMAVIVAIVVKDLWFRRLEKGKELADQAREDGRTQDHGTNDRKTQAEA